jgi:hypothetical protein
MVRDRGLGHLNLGEKVIQKYTQILTQVCVIFDVKNKNPAPFRSSH